MFLLWLVTLLNLVKCEDVVPLVRRNSLNSVELVKTGPSGMAGPNVGTSFERDTAMLQKTTSTESVTASVIDYSAP